MERWPNFIIVGAPKAGTTALYHYLNQHPKVYLSKIKEPGYFRSFIPENIIPLPITSKEKYLELFSDVKKEVAVGEASTVYLNDPGTVKIIHDAIPDCKIIIMLRDPIERTYSSYFQLRRIEMNSKILVKLYDVIIRIYKKVSLFLL